MDYSYINKYLPTPQELQADFDNYQSQIKAIVQKFPKANLTSEEVERIFKSSMISPDDFRGRILFDNQDNILAFGVFGVICFDGNTAQRKNLPFNFAFQPNAYKFVDFFYDSVNEAYILAWTELYEEPGMISEETTHQDGIPDVHVSIFSADGLLLYDYDTKLMLPQYRIFDEHWPVLSLDDADGLQLAGYYLDGSRRIWLFMPQFDYLKILQI